MQFLNTEIDPSALPAAEDLALRPISRDYLKILRTEWLITTLVLAVIAAAVIIFIEGMNGRTEIIAVFAVFLLLIGIYGISQEKAFPYRAFSVRQHDIIYQSGWIIRSVKICPLNRVLNCSIHAGPFERKYKLATLALFTAGTDMRIAGLTAEEAESIRQFVLTRINEEDKPD